MSGDLSYQPHILSEEEIEMYLKGDRREIDRLILYSINRLTAVIVPHAQREDARDKAFDEAMEQIGGVHAIVARARFVDDLTKTADEERARREFIDVLIEKQKDRNEMMKKVTASNVIWASIGFIGYVLFLMREALVSYVKARLGG